MGRRQDRAELLDIAREIAEEYAGNLTLRQLYYRCVAGGHIPNAQAEYKRLGEIVAQARMSGDFPFEWLLDRTRESRPGSFTVMQDEPDVALQDAADELVNAPRDRLWSHRWYGQPEHVSVWVEKEALAGVFERPCVDLGVSWFVLRGYSSLSSLYEWVKQLGDAQETRMEADVPIERATILYFGDHDPDGWEIPRSAFRNVQEIAQVTGIELPELRLQRVALTMAQIREHSPPPFPAKETSSRFDGYVREHDTHDAWELDALPPRELDTLIRSSVGELFDLEIRAENERHVKAERRNMLERMDDAWINRIRARLREAL